MVAILGQRKLQKRQGRRKRALRKLSRVGGGFYSSSGRKGGAHSGQVNTGGQLNLHVRAEAKPPATFCSWPGVRLRRVSWFNASFFIGDGFIGGFSFVWEAFRRRPQRRLDYRKENVQTRLEPEVVIRNGNAILGKERDNLMLSM